MSKTPAVFLDRDGTLNRDSGFVFRVEDLELLPSVCEGLRRMMDLDLKLFITTNQSGIARGYFTELQMHDFNRALCDRLASQGITIAAVYYCPYHPQGSGQFGRESPMRKPAPGMIELAAEEHALDLRRSFTIGDKSSDVEAGQAAGCKSILLRTATSAPLRTDADCIARDLIEAADYIEKAMQRLKPRTPQGRALALPATGSSSRIPNPEGRTPT